MSAHEIVIAVMAAFALLGAVDRIFGNRLGLGQEFEEGIGAMGALALAMLGIISLAPVLPDFLDDRSALVCSGILDSRLTEVKAALEGAGLTVTHVFEEEEWRCIRAKRSNG